METIESPDFIKSFTGKEAIVGFASYQTNLIKNGQVNALDYYIRSKALRKSLDTIDADIRDTIMAEADKYRGDGKQFNAHGATVTFADTGVSYDCSGCNDPEWNALSKQSAEIKEKLKERENFLKALKNPITVVDENTGETTQIHPAVRKGKEFITVTFK